MDITLIYHNTFDHRIVAVNQKNENEVLVLLEDKKVYSHELLYHTTQYLFTLETTMTYADGGFDITGPCSLYLLDELVVVSNDFQTHSIVHYPAKYTLGVQRKEYHCAISKFPIALYKDQNQVPHLIYAKAWNRVEILNLNDGHNLTADKSLIEVDAQDRKNQDGGSANKDFQIWPSEFDYFYADLKISPDHKYFLSKGWVWGSSDAFYVFEIKDFIENKRIRKMEVGFWEHDARAACWISNDELVVCCHAVIEDFDQPDPDNPFEIVHYQLLGKQCIQTKRTKVKDLTDTNMELLFHPTLQVLISYKKRTPGFLIFDLQGTTLYKDQEHTIESFDVKSLTFSSIVNDQLYIYQIQ